MLRKLLRNGVGTGAGDAKYTGHVPTGPVGKAVLFVDASLRAIADPRDARMVGVVGEVTGARALRRMRARMERHPVGRSVLFDRPLITSETVPLASLRAMPPRSLGGAYADFLERHGFDPDERSAVQFVDDEELAYVMTRYRQVHDLWHVLFGLPPSMLGEVSGESRRRPPPRSQARRGTRRPARPALAGGAQVARGCADGAADVRHRRGGRRAAAQAAAAPARRAVYRAVGGAPRCVGRRPDERLLRAAARAAARRAARGAAARAAAARGL